MSARDPGDPRCKDCPEPHEPGRARCEACGEAHRKAARARVAKRRRAGLCITCGKPVAMRDRDAKPGRYCARHQAYYLARALG